MPGFAARLVFDSPQNKGAGTVSRPVLMFVSRQGAVSAPRRWENGTSVAPGGQALPLIRDAGDGIPKASWNGKTAVAVLLN